MRKLIISLLLAFNVAPALQAADSTYQHRMSREEFRAKQQTYIAERAGLTKEEVAKFFPVYFELQDSKKELNDKAWSLLRKGRDPKATESQYAEILEGVYNSRIDIDKLEKNYYDKFKAILSNEKIYKVMQAEMSFHRDQLKGMRTKRMQGVKDFHHDQSKGMRIKKM